MYCKAQYDTLNRYNYELLTTISKCCFSTSNYNRTYFFKDYTSAENDIEFIKHNGNTQNKLKKDIQDTCITTILNLSPSNGKWTESYDYEKNDSIKFLPNRKVDDFFYIRDSLYNQGAIQKSFSLNCFHQPFHFLVKRNTGVLNHYAIISCTKISEGNGCTNVGSYGGIYLCLRKNNKWEIISLLEEISGS